MNIIRSTQSGCPFTKSLDAMVRAAESKPAKAAAENKPARVAA